MAQVIYAPEDIYTAEYRRVFLAGTIDMGNSHNWQEDVVEACKSYDITLYNPRRKDWDPTWTQSIDNPAFVEQVEWELDAIGYSTTIAFHFEADSISPISLYELGYCCGNYSRVIVHCPNGYFRKGNIDIIAKRHNNLVTQVESFDDFIKAIQGRL